MIGVNDLIAGRSNADILTNYDDIVGQLRDNHPDARIVVQSILPTDHHAVRNDRVRAINHQLAQMAQRHDAMYLDLYPHFSDEAGRLRAELTTDGIHLSDFGYEVWQSFLRQVDAQIAREERHSTPVHNVEEFHHNQSAQGVGM
jgi:lysophospholipase L1-like esterase